MQHAGAADLVEAVDLRDVSSRGFRDPPLCFNNHIVAIAEADRTSRAYFRARRLQSDFLAVRAERAFVDFRRKALVIVFRNYERACLHARAAANAARFVKHHWAEIRLRELCAEN